MRGNEATWTPTPTGSAPKTICPPFGWGNIMNCTIIEAEPDSEVIQKRGWAFALHSFHTFLLTDLLLHDKIAAIIQLKQLVSNGQELEQ